MMGIACTYLLRLRLDMGWSFICLLGCSLFLSLESSAQSVYTMPEEPSCDGCLPPFSPLPDSTYIVNAWVKEESAPLGTTHYTKPRIVVEVPQGNVIGTFAPVQSMSPMVDGWQLIEGSFIMPGTGEMKLSLICDGCTGVESVLFDDVRMFPAVGSMKSYVYDPENLRFVAELDERHFATFYEYDNEGKLVRVKKETERGIKTLKETRQNAPHISP